MSGSNEETLDHGEDSCQSTERNSDKAPTLQWEAMAQAWISSMPEGHILTMSEVEAWLASNQAPLPEELKSLPLSDLYHRITSIHISNQEQGMKDNQVDLPPAKFQRTDQWRPVYSWLESLDTDEVVKSKDVSGWLSDNPNVKEELASRHSRYHLMHYIKKCHIKILKRKEKKKLVIFFIIFVSVGCFHLVPDLILACATDGWH